MRVVIAPDKFAGTLTAAEAARAMAAGWRAARPDDELRVVPMADGGEGTLDVVAAVLPDAQRRTVAVADARGIETQAAWLLLADGRALVEAAQACGLSRLSPAQRNPRLTTTYGVGQLLQAAVAEGAREVVMTLGGSATVDGGAGMATALGHRLLREDGNGIKVGGEYLRALARVVAAPVPASHGHRFAIATPRNCENRSAGSAHESASHGHRCAMATTWDCENRPRKLGRIHDSDVPIVAAIDVTNPLLGRAGAAAVFGPQKGAGPDDIVVLEDALRTLADVAERDLAGGPWRNRPGAGAAGGLGFGLMAFCGASLRGGAGVVAELVGLRAALDGADVVLTGEGGLDAQSAAGKVPVFMLAAGRRIGARVLAIAGRIVDEAAEPFDAAAELGPRGLEAAAELVEARARELAEEIEV